MRKCTLLFVSLFAVVRMAAQVTLSFSPAAITVSESNGSGVLTHIKTAVTSAAVHNYTITLISGNSKDIGGFTTMNFSFGSGIDSIPFSLSVTDDSLIENSENFVFKVSSSNTTIGADSLFTLTITDNEVPLQINWALLHDTMPESTTLPTLPVYIVNPNPTPVYFYVKTYPAAGSATYGTDFTTNDGWYLADTGNHLAFVSPVTIINDTFLESYENVVIAIEPDSIPGSTVGVQQTNYWIANDDIFVPATIHFINKFYYEAWEDTIGVLSIYVERNNPNPYNVEYRIEQDLVNSTVTVPDYIFYPDYFQAPPGLSYDTLYVRINNDKIVEGIEYLFIKIRKYEPNISTDSIFTIKVIDKDTVTIGFKGASYSYVEKDAVYAIPVITTSPVPYDVKAYIKVVASSATYGADYICNDTMLHFLANSIDTHYVRVQLLDDSFFEGNEQINILIDSLSPAGRALFDTRQYSFFIIDNDENVGIAENDNWAKLSLYPNPTNGLLHIENPNGYAIALYTILAEKIELKASGDVYDLQGLEQGIYLLYMSDGERHTTYKIIKQ